jgi:hypothetical protein
LERCSPPLHRLYPNPGKSEPRRVSPALSALAGLDWCEMATKRYGRSGEIPRGSSLPSESAGRQAIDSNTTL